MGKINDLFFSEIEYTLSSRKMREAHYLRAKGEQPKTGRRERGQIWRRLNGSQSAIFKRISRGGTFHPKQLAGQMAYVNGKAQEVFGNSFAATTDKALQGEVVAELIEEWSSEWKGNPKNGQTSHMLMSFPAHVTDRQAVMITQQFCSEMFNDRSISDDCWQYYAALHTDTTNPHVHIILNNRGEDGEWFYMAQNHHFSYDLFRERMAEIAQDHGVYLDATSRLERGIIDYAPSSGDFQRAKRLGVTPNGRKREGAALNRAIARMAEYQAEYKSMAALARDLGEDQMAELLDEAETSMVFNELVEVPETDGVHGIGQHPADAFGSVLKWVRANEDQLMNMEPADRDLALQQVTEAIERIQDFVTKDFSLESEEEVIEVLETDVSLKPDLPLSESRLYERGGRVVNTMVGNVEKLKQRALEYLGGPDGAGGLNRFMASEAFASWIATGTRDAEHGRERGALYRALRDLHETDLTDVPGYMAQIAGRARPTGISPERLTKRLMAGARSREEQSVWMMSDIDAVAEKQKLDLTKSSDREKAVVTVQNVYSYANDILDRIEDQQVHVDEKAFALATKEMVKQMKARRNVQFSSRQAEIDYLRSFKAKFGEQRVEALAAGDLSVLDDMADQAQEKRDIAYATLKLAKKHPAVGISSDTIREGMDAYNPRIWHGRDGHSMDL